MGLFIVFEGIEGSGKSTQSRALLRRLIKLGYPSILVHEPGGTPTGEKIRRWLKSGEDLTPLTELFLFAAARAAIVEQEISPELEKGHTVICDRYFYSTLAYQGHGRGMDMALLQKVNRIAAQGVIPDLVVLLDIPFEMPLGMPFEKGIARKGGPRDRFEREGVEFHRRVREGYLALAQEEPERWLTLNATASRSALFDSIERRVLSLLEKAPAKDQNA